ncbi:MAG TPA: class I SAM-dependent methyltransferase [Gemmatimonadaceae bacterium]|jgi:ubiquinone/menaquinone biosynthesis C-methylase UbiE
MTNRAFYDAFAPRYHLIYENWNASIARQGTALDTLIREHFHETKHVTDVAVGIGTQALGLASLGYHITGSDLSLGAVTRARVEAESRALHLDLHVADFQRLPFAGARTDLVLCADNSLPHVASRDAVQSTLAEWRRCLRPGGGCLISMRDYGEPRPEGIIEERPYGERTWNEHRYLLRQMWRWQGPRYKTSLEMIPLDANAPAIEPIVATYLAISPVDVAQSMRDVGFHNVTRIDERFFQPILIATR